MSQCWPLAMPPTAKAVLISLADNANDHGECWPSLATIAVRTCFSERAVQNAIRWLESAKVLTADRSNGRHTRYCVTPAAYAPPQEMHPAAGATEPPQQVRQPPQEIPKPPQQVPSNRQEPSRTVKGNRNTADDTSARKLLEGEGIPEELIDDFLRVRRKHRAEFTATALAGFKREAAIAGMSLEAAIRLATESSWRGFKAEWVKQSRGVQQQAYQPSKRMQGLMRLEELKNGGLGTAGNHHGDAATLLLGARSGAGFRLGGGNGSGVGGGGET